MLSARTRLARLHPNPPRHVLHGAERDRHHECPSIAEISVGGLPLSGLVVRWSSNIEGASGGVAGCIEGRVPINASYWLRRFMTALDQEIPGSLA